MVTRPSKFPNQGDFLGSIVGMSDGQTHEVVQPNGIENGEVVFLPPKALLDGVKPFDNIRAKIPNLSPRSILSLNARDDDGNALFSPGINAGQVIPCLLNTIGIMITKADFVPPATKIGWYNPNIMSTKFGALNITNYNVMGESHGIATENIHLMKMAPTYVGEIGDLVMCGWESIDDFKYVVPLLTQVTKTNITTEEASGDIDPDQLNDFIVQIVSLMNKANPPVSAIGNNTRLVPNIDSEKQIYNTTAIGNNDVVDITYKYFKLGRIVPMSMMQNLVVGRIVYSDLTAGGYVAVDLSRRS